MKNKILILIHIVSTSKFEIEMFNLLVSISLLTSYAYCVTGFTLDASYLAQFGYNNQSLQVYFFGPNITDIDPNAFNGFTKLTQLTIASTKLSKIDLEVFKDAVNLQVLDLTENSLLTQVNNSKRIIFPFMESFTISYSGLTVLESSVINAFPNLTTFNCLYAKQLSALKPNQLSPWKKLKGLYITTKNQISLTKEHFNGLNSVESLIFVESNIKTIEVHTLLALPNVTLVDFLDNELTSFEYLQIPEKLTYLSLRGNKINYFKLSRTMGFVRKLYLDFNRFRSFKSMDFSFLTNLTDLFLNHNPHAYPSEIPSHLKYLVNLNHVELMNLSISSIDSNYFKQNTKLEGIYLGYNNISVVPFNTFSYLKNLSTINLISNQISVIDNKTFIGLSKLSSIILQSNKLTQIAPRTFYNLNSSYLTIDLSSNSISQIDSSAFKGSELFNIILENNRLSKISPGTFTNLKSLMYVNLKNNQITEIDNSTFEGVQNPNYIELSFNNISRITPGIFRGWKKIYLDNNMISTIEDESFKDFNRLEDIYLDNNNLSQMYSRTFAGCTALSDIYLSNNPNLPKANLGALLCNAANSVANCKVNY